MSLPRANFLRALCPLLAVFSLGVGGCPLGEVRCRSDVDCPSGEVCRSQACQAVVAATGDGEEGAEPPAETDVPVDVPVDAPPETDAALDGGVSDAG